MIIAAAVIAALTAGLTVVFGPIALAIWAAGAAAIGADDLIGKASALATPLAMDERIAASHTPDFLTVDPPIVPALPPMTGIANQGQRGEPRLIHPFVELPVKSLPVPECNPGSCPSGKVCLVNLSWIRGLSIQRPGRASGSGASM